MDSDSHRARFSKNSKIRLNNTPREQDAYTPTREMISHHQFVKPTWLVHFTDIPWEIASEGFVYGHDDMASLGLTTHFYR